jgi:hypothetical protein
VLTGCTSRQVRTELLKTFPLHTARASVEQRLAADRFDRKLDERRPSEGWTAHSQAAVGEQCLAVERRTGARVERCQYYVGVHGVFSLAFLWFYYDIEDGLLDIDAEIGD